MFRAEEYTNVVSGIQGRASAFRLATLTHRRLFLQDWSPSWRQVVRLLPLLLFCVQLTVSNCGAAPSPAPNPAVVGSESEDVGTNTANHVSSASLRHQQSVIVRGIYQHCGSLVCAEVLVVARDWRSLEKMVVYCEPYTSQGWTQQGPVWIRPVRAFLKSRVLIQRPLQPAPKAAAAALVNNSTTDHHHHQVGDKDTDEPDNGDDPTEDEEEEEEQTRTTTTQQDQIKNEDEKEEKEKDESEECEEEDKETVHQRRVHRIVKHVQAFARCGKFEFQLTDNHGDDPVQTCKALDQAKKHLVDKGWEMHWIANTTETPHSSASPEHRHQAWCTTVFTIAYKLPIRPYG